MLNRTGKEYTSIQINNTGTISDSKDKAKAAIEANIKGMYDCPRGIDGLTDNKFSPNNQYKDGAMMYAEYLENGVNRCIFGVYNNVNGIEYIGFFDNIMTAKDGQITYDKLTQ